QWGRQDYDAAGRARGVIILPAPLADRAMLAGVPVHVDRFLPPRYLTVIEGAVYAGSTDVVRDVIDWIDQHRVLTSPECWIDEIGRLAETMPDPTAALGLVDAHGQPRKMGA